jgi:hypothetical protein
VVADARSVFFDFSRQTVAVNHFYFYVQDPEWGPAFVKAAYRHCWKRDGVVSSGRSCQLPKGELRQMERIAPSAMLEALVCRRVEPGRPRQ